MHHVRMILIEKSFRMMLKDFEKARRYYGNLAANDGSLMSFVQCPFYE